jgi:hypothetical protein
MEFRWVAIDLNHLDKVNCNALRGGGPVDCLYLSEIKRTISPLGRCAS